MNENPINGRFGKIIDAITEAARGMKIEIGG